jgi:hypothetical protein
MADPQVPGPEFSPDEMLAHGMARAGRLKIPAHPGMVFDFLPVAWRTIQHYGVGCRQPGSSSFFVHLAAG